MSNSTKAQNVYDESVAELNRILGSFTATDQQKEVAQNALNTLATREGATIIESVESRTALLNSLVSELNTVIAAVRVNPIGNAVDTLDHFVRKAEAIIEDDSSEGSGTRSG